jgi:glycosyltransferase involved in cell wall biosynthesis
VTPQDACSRSILEAMAMARAIVAMNNGGNPELIEQGKSGILIDDRRALVDAVVHLLDHAEERQELGIHARARAEASFDIKTNALNTQQLYLDLIK